MIYNINRLDSCVWLLPSPKAQLQLNSILYQKIVGKMKRTKCLLLKWPTDHFVRFSCTNFSHFLCLLHFFGGIKWRLTPSDGMLEQPNTTHRDGISMKPPNLGRPRGPNILLKFWCYKNYKLRRSCIEIVCASQIFACLSDWPERTMLLNWRHSNIPSNEISKIKYSGRR